MPHARPTHPMIPDPEMFQDFVDALGDQIPKIERDIGKLKHTPNDRAVLADLFRAMHNLKGDAALCKLDLAVRIAHPIESILGRLRDGTVSFSNLLGEAILLALDRLELAIEALGNGRSLESLRLDRLLAGLDRLGALPDEEIMEASADLIQAVTGFRPAAELPLVEKGGAGRRSRSGALVAGDLQFFRSLALQFENRSPLFRGRTNRVLRLALATNTEAGQPEDPVQLEAAVYLHDVGMMLLPESVWLKVGKLSEADKRALRSHPLLAAGLLERMEGWQGAAAIVAQHHELPDGTGYPGGLRNGEICPGAKLLAIVDAFEAVTLKQSHRGQTRSLLRAIAEINACDKQFAPEWITHFNAVIRRQVEGR